ncbi:M24 family metallopeptidase [Salisediminibacterium beveridgei]|uniref:Putative dipeptidase ykvY n=1 Tax=Salisediminibacterium beveridgei TaxID=632773 RepID=A0A1D7QT87_9BACI|nr:Xaa-Pro peptidase family protein [Salisediminibacterium beveridgei]AOM82246.1 Putative dipeptidase ykvY [Salisediminibacterium beveridgei]
MNERIKTLQENMNRENIDYVMVQSRPNVFYLTGFDADPHERLLGVVIPKEGNPTLICPQMEVNQISKLFNPEWIIGYTDSEDPWSKLFSALQPDAQVVALEENIPWTRFTSWQSNCPGSRYVTCDHLLNAMRLTKSDEEISIMKEAAALADQGIQAGVDALKEGVTEMEVIAQIEYTLKKEGVREMSFSTMALFGEKCGDPHGNPGMRTLQKGDAVLFDLGVEWKGYTSDMTRTVFFGEVSEEQRTIYQTVLNAHLKAVALCKPGTLIQSLDQTARKEIEEAGYGNYFPHRIGHGIGIQVHEFPSLNDQNQNALTTGMTFTIEPGIYIPDISGVRIEDEILITEDGCVSLNSFPKDLQVIWNS